MIVAVVKTAVFVRNLVVVVVIVVALVLLVVVVVVIVVEAAVVQTLGLEDTEAVMPLHCGSGATAAWHSGKLPAQGLVVEVVVG